MGLCYHASWYLLLVPRAMLGYELRQARKGATVVAGSCVAEWLARATNLYQTENEYVCLNLLMKSRSLEQSQ